MSAEDLGFSSGTGALRRRAAMESVVDLGADGVCGIPGSNGCRRVGVLLHGSVSRGGKDGVVFPACEGCSAGASGLIGATMRSGRK